MKFSKLAPLKDAERRRARTGRTREMLQTMETLRFPSQFTREEFGLSHDECAHMMLRNNRDIVERGGTERLYGTFGPQFADNDHSYWYLFQYLGWPCLHHGWSIVPQDRPGRSTPGKIRVSGTGGAYRKANYSASERRPALIPRKISNGRSEREFTHAFLPTEFRENRMSIAQFLMFSEHLHAANLAIQCCAASGHVRALDIDCLDPEVAETVKRIAFDTLGATPFIRYGKRPKALLLYRVEGEDIDIKKFSIGLDVEGSDVENAIEWLAEGSLFTAYGLHHTTFESFDWSEGSMHPAMAGPEHAPVVNKAMLRKFTNAIQQVYKVRGSGMQSTPFGGKAAVSEFRKEPHHRQPFWAPKVVEGDFTVDEDGMVIDGAEKWLTGQAWALCGSNAEHLKYLMPELVDWLTLEATIKLSPAHRDNTLLQSEDGIRRAAKQRLESAARKWIASVEAKARSGSYHKGIVPYRISDDGRRPMSQRVRPAERPADGSLDWLPADSCPVDALAETRAAATSVVAKSGEQVSIDRASRALIEDLAERRRVTDRVSDETRGAIKDWLNESVSPWNEIEEKKPADPWVLISPTGAGKTVGAVEQLAEWCKANPRKPNEGPVLLVLPTHANADEALSKAMDLGMFSPNLWSDKQIEGVVESGEGLGVKIVPYKGRLAAGCERRDEMAELQKAGIGASNLCGTRIIPGDKMDQRKAREKAREEGKKVKKTMVLCPFRERGECGYYLQQDELKDADIVVLAHAYLTLALPDGLRDPRAVIIDESTTYALLQQRLLPVSVLNLPRREPFVSKMDRKRWPDWSDEQIKAHHIGGREELAGMVGEWISKGRDVIQNLFHHEHWASLIESAIVVCERANDRSRKLTPELTREQVLSLAGEDSGRMILQEIQYWKILRDRLQSMAKDKAAYEAKGDYLTPAEKKAKGKTDMRLQVVEAPEKDPATGTTSVTKHILVSWRKTPNWSGIPTLLLDASAKPAIVKKLFGGDPVIREVKAPSHGRTVAMIEKTWSNASFVPRWDATSDELKRIAQTIDEARKLITTTAVIYGHGRVLVGTTIAVREAINNGEWVAPPNVDFVHFGALRGLDFAKGHAAAISIGRSEMPIQVIDGYRGALTYDDDYPEEPYDQLGTGVTIDGKPLFRQPRMQRIEMRTGQDVEHMVPCMPRKKARRDTGSETAELIDSWATLLEESWREEEIRQFLGRLRLVYRGVANDADGNPIDGPPPLWIAAGKIIPSGVVVDEITEMAAMVKISPLCELARLSGGVLAPNVTPHVPGAQSILHGRTLNDLVDETLPKSKEFLRRFAGPFKHVRYTTMGDDRVKSAMLLPGFVDGDPVAHWQALSERYGELPDVEAVFDAKLQSVGGKAKPLDKRDIDRDDALEMELSILLNPGEPVLEEGVEDSA